MDEMGLVVTKSVTGELETNIAQIEQFVEKKLEEYDAASYGEDISKAKKDRAELNNSKKFLAQARSKIKAEFLKPFTDFELRCKAVEEKIGNIAAKIDEVVKAKEGDEKAKKRARIDELWLSLNFTLFPVDKVFEPRWLNKGTKESEIVAEMKVLTSKVYRDLKKIEEQGEDFADVLKAFYLNKLDLSATLEFAETLKKNNEAVREESETREEREHNEAVEAQEKAIRREMRHEQKGEFARNLAAEALGLEPKEEIEEFVLSMKVTKSTFEEVALKLCDMGIEFTYQKIEF